jgi:hypothetical protein
VSYDDAGLNVKVAVPADTTSNIHTPTACCYGNGGVQVLLLIHSQNFSESIDSFLLQKWFQDANSLTCQCNASCILLAPPRQG